MTSLKIFFSVLLFVILPGFIFPLHCSAEAKESSSSDVSTKPIVILSKTLEVDNEKKIVTFTGEVNAKKDDFVVDCQKMLVYYRTSPDKGKKEAFAQGIDRIVASGQVRVTRKEGGLATADKAVYYQDDDKLVLTGNPSVQQGKDLVKGERIIIFLRENRSIVESSGKERAQAIIFPRARKRETP
ncbi:MAG: lipopolysaccharide transport periplasmic protein LptA [Deltaproteobacteria bacterium]|nr:lipopolysaccharide transport periplasmic protein LptA [Deltaproteobacteria bacterium]